MSKSLWPEGKKSVAMFSFDLDGDIIWQNMSSDEPNTEKLIRARSIGQYGPNRCVDMILDLLDKYNVKATFYVPGYVADHNPDVIRRIDAAGHEIGNHGYTHERFVEMSVEEQLAVLTRTQESIRRITGKTPVEFLTDVRIRHACFLMEFYGETLSLGQVAEQCGYNDYVYFSKKFKQAVGLSPRAYQTALTTGVFG